MAIRRAWIRADIDDTFGALNIYRAVAIAQAAKREGIDQITVITRIPGDEVLNAMPVDGVEYVAWDKKTSVKADAEMMAEILKPFAPGANDSRKPRPLVYLLGSRFEAGYQRMMWKLGAETVVIQDNDMQSYADWCVIPKPYGAELEMETGNGYTYFLRGANYSPIRSDIAKAIMDQRDHATYATKFAVSTENLDAAKWIGAISEEISKLEKPAQTSISEWKPELTIIAGPGCPADADLKAMVKSGVEVNVASDRYYHAETLKNTEVLFAPDGIVIQEALALGIPVFALPLKNGDTDLMRDHLIRREVSPELPDPADANFAEVAGQKLNGITFDPALRRAKTRIGQYLCDGLGAYRLVRQTAHKVYTPVQNVVRYFDLGDPEVKKL